MGKSKIKLRAWDSYHESMIVQSSEMNPGDILSLDESDSSSKYTVMQFSGLLDVNGVEIFEGDVIYLYGYGLYEVEFPFLQLYKAYSEGDIGSIRSNTYE